jgi:hypothetical protein
VTPSLGGRSWSLVLARASSDRISHVIGMCVVVAGSLSFVSFVQYSGPKAPMPPYSFPVLHDLPLYHTVYTSIVGRRSW